MLICKCIRKWAAALQNDLCAQQRFRSAWAFAQSDQSSLSAWRSLVSLATHWVHSKDQSVFAGRTCHFVGFVVFSFHRGVIEHVIQNFADKIQATPGEDEESKMQIDIDYYRLNEDKVCRFFAEQILKHARKVFTCIIEMPNVFIF